MGLKKFKNSRGFIARKYFKTNIWARSLLVIFCSLAMLILKSPSIFKSNFTCKVIFSKVKKKSWRTYFEVECPGPNHLPNWSRHQIVEGSAVSLKLVALKRQKMRTTHAALLWREKIFCPICCWTQKCIIFTLKTTSHCGQITILDYRNCVIKIMVAMTISRFFSRQNLQYLYHKYISRDFFVTFSCDFLRIFL